jgi:hypothetical protein
VTRAAPFPGGAAQAAEAVYSPAQTSAASRLLPHLQKVAQLYRDGWTVSGIARHMGIQPRTVVSYAVRARQRGADVPPIAAIERKGRVDPHKAAAMFRAGKKRGEIAEHFGVSPGRISAALHDMARAGVALPPLGRWGAAVSTDAIFRRAVQIGIKATAREFGMDPHTVQQRLYVNGLSVRAARRDAIPPPRPAGRSDRAAVESAAGGSGTSAKPQAVGSRFLPEHNLSAAAGGVSHFHEGTP